MRRSPTSRHRPNLPALARGLAAVAVVGSVALAATPVGAQQPPPPVMPPVAAVVPAPDTTAQAPGSRGVSPRGAFLRAVAIPGWGHASIQAYRRGGFYFVVESVTAWGLIKTHQRIKEVNGRVRFRQETLLADLGAQGVTDPADIKTALDDDETLTDLLALQTARKSQREDWTSMGIFLLFLSGADAYVSAHLAHFPVPLTLDAEPAGAGRVDVSVGVKLPR